MVIIFDECNRGQFGDMHGAIGKHFRKYHLFGFTGTPIFSVNARASSNAQFFSTAQIFEDHLYAYTIVDAINDKNVLPLSRLWTKKSSPMAGLWGCTTSFSMEYMEPPSVVLLGSVVFPKYQYPFNLVP